jgi:hypothetical protein
MDILDRKRFEASVVAAEVVKRFVGRDLWVVVRSVRRHRISASLQDYSLTIHFLQGGSKSAFAKASARQERRFPNQGEHAHLVENSYIFGMVKICKFLCGKR